MHSPFYLLIWVTGVCCLWVLWDLGFRRVFLDLFRERIFELRYALFRLGMDGELHFDSDVYRTLEILMCGLLRFGHRMTLLTYIFSRVEQKEAKREKNHLDLSQQLELKISRLDPHVQPKVRALLHEVRRDILLYMAFTSLWFLAILFAGMVARGLGVWRSDRVTNVIEQEAYWAESRGKACLAAA
jgi:hypothetical protein